MTKKILIFTGLLLLAIMAGSYKTEVSPVFTTGSFLHKAGQSTEAQTQTKSNVAFVGDVLLARHVEKIQNNYGLSYVFAALPLVASTTYLVGNFESTVPENHEPTPDMTMSFSTASSALVSLTDYGFSHLSLANNHSYDKGLDGFLHTQKSLQAAGLTWFGDQFMGSTSVSYVELEEKVVALVGVYAVDQAPMEEKLQLVFNEAERNSDFQIAYVHWGTEYELTHSLFQETFARELIDAGADSVIGHHPHVVQDIDVYNNAIIFYSLGNFVFDQYFSRDVQEGLWVNVTFVDNAPQYTLKPVTALGSYSQPRFMSGYNRDIFLDTLAKRSNVSLREQIISGILTAP
jgi:poly-gamma-glutamate synthesis protein (capsule biosynthesis protein)